MAFKAFESSRKALEEMLELVICLVLAVLYVASLYIWSSENSRDHPETIKKRFLSVSVIMLISPVFVYAFSKPELLERFTLWQLLGFRRDTLALAILLPLLLTAILFLGPLSVQISNGVWRMYLRPAYWLDSFHDLLWLRNHIVAPLSEEFTFRACMLPLLMQNLSLRTSIFITPLFFGVAHFHHLIERISNGMDKKTAIIVSCFQFVYTTIFGIYSAYLFVRTGHFAAPFVAHAFCNSQGFPDIQELVSQPTPRRNIFYGLYITGLITWLILLPYLTDPAIYANELYEKIALP